MKKLSKVIMAGIAGLMLMSGPASGDPRVLHLFHADMSNAIEADLDSDLINVGRKNKENNIIFQDCDPACGVDFTLGAFWQTAVYLFGNNGMNCFPANDESGTKTNVTGAIHLKVKKNGDAKATFWFTAKNKDSDALIDVNYQLILTDTDGGWEGTFPPPDLDGINSTTTMVVTGWELVTEGKGKFRRTACKGMNTNANATIVLTRIAIPIP